MRYTKLALLTFGAGLILGLVVVVAEIDWLGRVASGVMALGLAAIPVAMIADWRLATKARPGAKRARLPARHSSTAAPVRAPRRRKSAPKR